jgi:hypothetical protein
MILGMFSMGILDFFKSKGQAAVTYRLIWFELQEAPFSYRFAIIPEQPILIGFEGEKGEKGATMLIRYDHVPELYERTVESVSKLVQKSGVMELTPKNPQSAFDDGTLERPSVHLRIAYSDDRRWAGVFEINKLPKEIEVLLQETRQLAKQLMQDQSNETISGEIAHGHLDPVKNIAQKDSPAIVVKIRVHLTGKIFVDEQEMSLSELGDVLDELKTKNGVVWYFRETPDKEPPESVNEIIKKVLDAVTARNLPIQLQTEEY